MFRTFYPREYRESAYDLPYERFYKKGIRGVIFDLDNTLVPHGAAPDRRSMELFLTLKNMGLDTCLLSNNRQERVAGFANQVHSKYICKAGKPAVRGYQKAMAAMGTDAGSTLFVGDQLFTDIYGANRAGIYGILVRPIHPSEEFQIVLKRRLERIVLHFYKRDRRKQEEKRQEQKKQEQKKLEQSIQAQSGNTGKGNRT